MVIRFTYIIFNACELDYLLLYFILFTMYTNALDYHLISMINYVIGQIKVGILTLY